MGCDEMLHKDLIIEGKFAIHKAMEGKRNCKFIKFDPNYSKRFVFKIISDKNRSSS